LYDVTGGAGDSLFIRIKARATLGRPIHEKTIVMRFQRRRGHTWKILIITKRRQEQMGTLVSIYEKQSKFHLLGCKEIQGKI